MGGGKSRLASGREGVNEGYTPGTWIDGLRKEGSCSLAIVQQQNTLITIDACK